MRTFPKLSKKPNAHGSYEILWSENVNGKWRSKRRSTKTGNREEAEAELSKFLTLRNASDLVQSRTLKEIAEVYFRLHSRPKGNEKSDRQNLRAPIGAFGDTMAHQIEDSDVEAYSRRREIGSHGAKPVKPATIRREINALQAVLNFGSRKKLIPGSPTFRFSKPTGGKVRDRWLTEEQEREVLAELPSAPLTVRIFTRLGLTYGARKGAMLELRYGPQVNFLTGIIDFNVPGRPVSRKRRTVAPMTATIRGDLEEMFKSKKAGDRVCDHNTPYLYEQFMEGIGYSWVTPHVLKHTAITLMLRQGVPPGDVAKLTSTDLRTIYSVYRHHTVDELLNIAERRGI